mgnify:CR=1 FL=1
MSKFVNKKSTYRFRHKIKGLGIFPLQEFLDKKLPKAKEIIARYTYFRLENHNLSKNKLCCNVAEDLIRKWKLIFNLPVQSRGRVWTKVDNNF